jgi:hypothetical protein
MTALCRLPLFAAALLLAACADLMRIDFETDPVNQPPLEMPPSAELDLVTTFPAGGDIRVVNVDPVSGSRSLRLAGPSPGTAGQPRVRFQAQPLSASGRTVVVQWRGEISPDAIARFQIGVLEGSSELAIAPSLRFGNGIVTLGGISLTSYEPNESHLVSVVVDLSNGQSGLVLEGGVGENQVLSNTLEIGATQGRTVFLDAILESATGDENYRIDNLFAQDRGAAN